MRYAMASLFALLVVGMASTVPDGSDPTASRLPVAPDPAECEISPAGNRLDDVASAPDAVTGKTWAGPRTDLQRSGAPSAETSADVTAALHTWVACVNTRGDLQALSGGGTERTALVWIGEPWLLPDDRVAAPTITRHGNRAEAWRLVILVREGDRYLVDEFLTVGPRSEAQTVSPFDFGST